ncbi:MAG: hypothetical protein FWD06_05520 [Oscillospiraceae bacterium]|nr:hypothetical protein [Oscillospiraceae bacterium]
MQNNWNSCVCVTRTPWGCWRVVGCSPCPQPCLGPCKPCVPCYGGPCRGCPRRWRPRPNPYYGGYYGGAEFFVGDYRDFSEIERLPDEPEDTYEGELHMVHTMARTAKEIF